VFSHVGATRAFNQNFLTFNSLNSFILKGDGAQGMELTFASLMARAGDEPDALYGIAARAARISPDGLTYRFLMRPGITFHDGSPLTAHDQQAGFVIKDGKRVMPRGEPISVEFLLDGPSLQPHHMPFIKNLGTLGIICRRSSGARRPCDSHSGRIAGQAR
jgi:Bacterial extracellular solute-binding proteins, family 5 Middle